MHSYVINGGSVIHLGCILSIQCGSESKIKGMCNELSAVQVKLHLLEWGNRIPEQCCINLYILALQHKELVISGFLCTDWLLLTVSKTAHVYDMLYVPVVQIVHTYCFDIKLIIQFNFQFPTILRVWFISKGSTISKQNPSFSTLCTVSDMLPPSDQPECFFSVLIQK